jgi:alkylation response protein AidB-like acyl-CoA dehydrogenase
LLAASEPIEHVNIDQFRGWRCIAVCAEAIAAMQAALDLTVEHVCARVQFGRPIGSLQAVQHRLAECSVLLHGARLLLYRAAVDGICFAETAAIATHEAVKRVLYETSQFHGAIGLTLEYPLHLWSYRLRVLQFELAGAVQTAVEKSRGEGG